MEDKRNDQSATCAITENSNTLEVQGNNLVTWDALDDPRRPQNWTRRRRWLITFVVSCCSFTTPATTSIVTPALHVIVRDFHISSNAVQQMIISIVYLGLAVGLLLLGRLSEVFGRLHIMLASNFIRIICTVACGVSQNTATLLVFRFLTGVVGSAPLAVSAGVLSDIWQTEERGSAFALYAMMPLLGSACGPIAGGFITEKLSWRWTLYSAAIVDGGIQVLSLLCLRETYEPRVLQLLARKARKDTGNMNFYADHQSSSMTLVEELRRAIIYPCILFCKEPIIQVLACYMAYVYGLAILVLSTFSGLWINAYDESLGIAGLNYISLAIGYVVGTQICGIVNDRVYVRLKARAGDVDRPEYRLPLMLPGSVFILVGLLLYGWAAQAHLHWVLPNLGVAIFSAGVEISTQNIQLYLIDAYPECAASALAAGSALRCVAGFGFPLFAPYMYEKLDYGWGNSALSLIALLVGIPAPLLLWLYGQRLRGKSWFV